MSMMQSLHIQPVFSTYFNWLSEIVDFAFFFLLSEFSLSFCEATKLHASSVPIKNHNFNNYIFGIIPYSGNIWQWESSAYLTNRPSFSKLLTSQMLVYHRHPYGQNPSIC